ncbi:MAG: saccharopine dehydrogenase (NAD+, L-lysine-forming), partial [Rickettsiales bacterium]
KAIIIRQEAAGHSRSPFSPKDVGSLVASGNNIFVVKDGTSKNRAYDDSEFAKEGATMITSEEFNRKLLGGELIDSIIVGVKELPEEVALVGRCHYVYFAHMFKGQAGANEEILRYVKASFLADREGLDRPVPVDIEYLVDDQGKRVAAFGESAGFNGTAIGIITWCRKMLKEDVNQEINPHLGAIEDLVKYLKEQLEKVFEQTGKTPSFTILGKKGRSGTGAQNLLKQLEIDSSQISALGREDTMKDGQWRDEALEEIAKNNILVNCIFMGPDEILPPLLSKDGDSGKLQVVSDVTCEVGKNNPIFAIKEATTLEEPTIRIGNILITNNDGVPRFTPRAASEDFSTQLLQVLNQEYDGIEENPIVSASIITFEKHFKVPFEAFKFGVGMAARYVSGISESPEMEVKKFLFNLKNKNPDLDENKLSDVRFFIGAGAKQHFEDKKIVGQIAIDIALDDIFSKEDIKDSFNNPSGEIHVKKALLVESSPKTNSRDF